jgi:hypothetical protein
MVFLAIIIYILSNIFPRWILKERYKQLEDIFSWKIPFMKLSGLVFTILLAFLVTFGISISTKDRYIENRNAIYGLEFNSVMEELGFWDGMKIISINGEKIERVSDIVKKIVLVDGEIEVVVEKNGIQSKIILSQTDQNLILQNPDTKPVVPIMCDSSGKNEIRISTKNFEFSDVLNTFGSLWKQALIFINPNPSPFQSLGGFVVISAITNFRGYLMVLSLNLIIVVILNFLPLPGFSLGNFSVSVIETIRKKQYNLKMKRIIGWISIFLVIGILIIRMI